MRPKSEEQVELAIRAHVGAIVRQISMGIKMMENAVMDMEENDQPRDLRILAASWRHMTAEEKAQALVSPFLGAGRIAIGLAMDEYAKNSIEAKPLSTKIN